MPTESLLWVYWEPTECFWEPTTESLLRVFWHLLRVYWEPNECFWESTQSLLGACWEPMTVQLDFNWEYTESSLSVYGMFPRVHLRSTETSVSVLIVQWVSTERYWECTVSFLRACWDHWEFTESPPWFHLSWESTESSVSVYYTVSVIKAPLKIYPTKSLDNLLRHFFAESALLNGS